jgi:hypothetical protein
VFRSLCDLGRATVSTAVSVELFVGVVGTLISFIVTDVDHQRLFDSTLSEWSLTRNGYGVGLGIEVGSHGTFAADQGLHL